LINSLPLNAANYSCIISYNIANNDDNDDSGMSLMDMVSLVHRRKELNVGHRIPDILDDDDESELEEEDSNQE
jgi:hypothetical protein